TYEITFEEKTSLYYSSQEIFSEETEEDLDTSFNELSELKLFEFNEKNYINVQNALEQEVVKYLSDENEEEFGTYEDQEVPPPPVEDANKPVYRLNPAMYTNFSPCILVDYLDNKLQTCGQTKN
ncbi:7096_t:CDS:1, partial [Rhizophagus irregularis]